ncbi:Serum paraoxonase/arylesterase 1 [Clydaea vesicula]|uniref:Serum paraoxonase/arylesterase 1 n=1 Tax=Clydaea vesicula TaxID=447962 RepID=A0AAD5XVM2_9FUNG|nr:Serum paraoxonase/arylesterase 1 [Clydaea vesicula]
MSSSTSTFKYITLAIFVLSLALLAPTLKFYYTALEIAGPQWGISTFNRENCELLKENTGACEDISFHQALGIAFMSCDDPKERFKWFPPLAKVDNTGKATGRIFLFDLKTEKFIKLNFKNFDMEGLHSHGSSVWQDPSDPNSKIVLAFINHRKTGSVIEIFEYEVGSTSVLHVETIKNDILTSPNNLVLVGPRSFYATNDLKNPRGIKRDLEIYLRYKNGYVVFYDGETSKFKVVAKDLIYANGIETNYNQDKVYVAEATGSFLTVFERKQNNNLRKIESLAMPMNADNIFVSHLTGDIYVTGLSADPFSNKISGKTVKITNSTSNDKFLGRQYSKEIVFADDGKLISSPTITVVDVERKISLISGLFNFNVVLCRKAL